MCQVVYALLQSLICGIQMLVRIFITATLMIENLLRMLLQTIYNFISFVLQLISLLPICLVFLLTSQLKCLICGGGGQCPLNHPGACDCLISAIAFVLLFLIFQETGLLEKIFLKFGYSKTPVDRYFKYDPIPSNNTEVTGNDTEETTTESTEDTEYDSQSTPNSTNTESNTTVPTEYDSQSTPHSTTTEPSTTVPMPTKYVSQSTPKSTTTVSKTTVPMPTKYVSQSTPKSTTTVSKTTVPIPTKYVSQSTPISTTTKLNAFLWGLGG